MSSYNLLILPLLIFLARIADVSLGTIRIIFISRGIKLLAALVGFFEVLIWLLAITQIMKNLNCFYFYLVYAGGFASGTYIGIWLENKIALGVALIRIFIPEIPSSLLDRLKSLGFGLTTMTGQGLFHSVQIVFMIVKRKDIKLVLNIVQDCNPQAVYTVEDIRSFSPTAFPDFQTDDKNWLKKFSKFY